MATISKLVVSLQANSTKLVSQLAKSRKTITKWAGDVSKRIRSIGKAFSVLSLVAVGGFIVAMNRSAAAIDDVTKAAGKLNFPIEDYQKFAFIASKSNISMDNFGKSMQRMLKTVGDARAGLTTASDAFDQLGLNADELSKMNPSEQFEAIAEGMKGVATQSDKVKVAMDIFGRSGSDLLNVFAGDVKGIGDQFDSLGVVITKQQSEMVAAYQDSKTTLSKLFGGFKDNVTAEVSPAFTLIIDKIVASITKMGGMKVAANAAAKFVISALKSMAVGVFNLSKVFDDIEGKLIDMQAFWVSFTMPFSLDMREDVKKLEELSTRRGEVYQNINTKHSDIVGSMDTLLKDLQGTFDNVGAEPGKVLDKSVVKNEDGSIDFIASAKARILADGGVKEQAEKTSEALSVLTSSVNTAAKSQEKANVRDQFNQYANLARANIRSGSEFAGSNVTVLENLLQSAKSANVNLSGEVASDATIDAMQAMIDELKNVQTASQDTATSIKDLNQNQASQSLGSLTLNMITDTGKIAGEIFAKPEFVIQLKDFVDRQTNNAARQAAN